MNNLLIPEQQEWIVGLPIPTGLVAAVESQNDFVAPLVYSAAGLPLGVSMNSSGVFSGTPVEVTRPGTAVITVKDANGIRESEGFIYVVTDDAADSTVSFSPTHLDFQSSPCNPFSGGIPSTPSIAATVLAAQATQRVLYPEEDQTAATVVQLPVDGTIFNPPRYIIGDVAGTATIVDGSGNSLTDFPITGQTQAVAITAISTLSTTTKVWGFY